MLRCDHCLLEFPDRDAVSEAFDGIQKTFCCNGCQGIYSLIQEEGLDRFYAQRKWDDAGVPASVLTKEMDLKAFSEHVRDLPEGKEIDVYIDGIRCASCVWLNEKILSRTPGIEYVRVNYATHKARVKWKPEIIGLETILKRILSIGYNPKPYSESEQFLLRKAEARDLLVRFGTAGFLSSQLMIYSIALYAGYFQGIDSQTKLIMEIIAMALTFPVIFYSGMPFLRSTIQGLRHMRFTMDSLIAIGAGSAFLYSVYEMLSGGEVYFDTAAMIITLILLGRYLEATAKGKASETIERLTELRPREARKVVSENTHDAGRTVMVTLESIKKGDLIEVVPGERIPLDGKVVQGESEVDEAFITGESKPVLKILDSEVIGGSMNLYGSFVFEVTRTGSETVLSGIIRAVEDAQARKPRIQTLADRVVGYFVPVILLVALATVVIYLMRGVPIHRSLMTGISVLVIACPCSLGLATPLAVLIFTAKASSRGILIRGGEVIEKAGRTNEVVFDKTGTITRGKPSLKDIEMIDQAYAEDYVIGLVSSMERLSEHSIGHAICNEARVRQSPVPDFPVAGFRAIPGKGVTGIVDGKDAAIGNRGLMLECGVPQSVLDVYDKTAGRHKREGDTVVYAAWDKGLRALFVISDIVREEAAEVIRDIRDMGCAVAIISGDNTLTTNAIAAKTGVDLSAGETSPVGKKEKISELQAKGMRVMMVGDGINDAPALTEAHVGVAMGRGTDIAMESADVVLVRNDLRLIPYFIKLSKKTYPVIIQNVFWAFFYNIIAIPLAVSGVLHPIIAAAAMAASSLFVVLNSLRIKRLG